MYRILGSTLVSAALLLPVAAQQTTVTCVSQNGQSQTCPANTRDGVLLVHEQSNNVCRQGSTWSYNRTGIQVSGGCAADFAVSDRGNGNGYGNNGYGNNGYGNNGANNSGVNGNGYNSNNYNGNTNGPAYGNNSRALPTLPQGTQLTVRMDQTVRLTELNQGDIIPGTLTNDLTVGGQVIAPAGSHVQAKVASAQGAPLDLRLDSLAVNNQTYALQTNSIRGIRDAVSTGDQVARSGFGGVLSTLAQAGQITSGTVFNFRLTAAARASATN